MIPRKGLQAYSRRLFYQMNSFTGIIHILYYTYILDILFTYYIYYILYILGFPIVGWTGEHAQLKMKPPNLKNNPPSIKT